MEQPAVVEHHEVADITNPDREVPLEIRLSRAFIAAAEEGSITKAATRLFVGQPALSRQIRQLERNLGISLLQRRSTGVVPTLEGAAFLPKARALVAQMDETIRPYLNPDELPSTFVNSKCNAGTESGQRIAMPMPLPSDDVDLNPPTYEETTLVIRGILSAVAPVGGPTQLQRELFAALSHSMTGHDVDTVELEPLAPAELAEALSHRNVAYRTRISQLMLLGELVLSPLPAEVSDRVDTYIRELSVSDQFVQEGRAASTHSLGLALTDFSRNGYSATWAPETFPLHTSTALESAWQQAPSDAALAQRWQALAELPVRSLGRTVSAFYRNRGFKVPGTAGSAPPLLAQHDWVHVLADYGATLENEVEVFAFISRASPNPTGFALLAMVIGLFETGAVEQGAGMFFAADAGHLSRAGMSVRLADAFLRGANCGRDLMTIDWFDYAAWPIEDVRRELAITAKCPEAIAAGSASPWQADGITPFQLRMGQELADQQNRIYEPLLPH